MRLKRHLDEKYLTLAKSSIGNIPSEIYINPSDSELKKIIKPIKIGGETIDTKSVRFIADSNNKKVYAWNAYLLLHKYAWQKIGDGRPYYHPSLFAGTARFMGGKWVVTQSAAEKRFPPKKADARRRTFEWLDKYFDIDRFFDSRRQLIER